MESIFSNLGYSPISDRIIKYLLLKDLSNLSKVNKSMATSMTRFWLRRFIGKFQLKSSLQEFYTSLTFNSSPEIQRCLGYIMRIRVEYGFFTHANNLFCPSNCHCPLALSLFLNQVPLAKLILDQFSNVVKDFSIPMRFAISGDFSIDILKSLLKQWKENYPSESKNWVLDIAAGHGDELKFQTLLDLGLVPSNECERRPGIYTPMDIAVSKGYIGIVKILLPRYDDLDRPMKLAISKDNEDIIEILFDKCKVPSSQELSNLSINSWSSTWTYKAAIYGKDKALQKLITLEKKNPLPSSLEDQFSYLLEVIQKGSAVIERYV